MLFITALLKIAFATTIVASCWFGVAYLYEKAVTKEMSARNAEHLSLLQLQHLDLDNVQFVN
jgi:hypothetical protein